MVFLSLYWRWGKEEPRLKGSRRPPSDFITYSQFTSPNTYLLSHVFCCNVRPCWSWRSLASPHINVWQELWWYNILVERQKGHLFFSKVRWFYQLYCIFRMSDYLSLKLFCFVLSFIVGKSVTFSTFQLEIHNTLLENFSKAMTTTQMKLLRSFKCSFQWERL